jgi:beta-N-acetylhexosaminidase
VEAVTAALQAGAISSERFQEALERVLEVKRRFLSWDDVPSEKATVPSWVGGTELGEARDRVYDHAITVVRNNESLLPLKLEASERLWVLEPEVERKPGRTYPREHLVNCLRQYHANSEMLSSPSATGENVEEDSRALLAATGENDVIVAITINAHRGGSQANLLERLLAAGRRVIVIAVAQPYDLLAFPELGTYLTTYEYTAPALEATARVLFGVVQARGTLPVSLSGLYDLVKE